MSAGLELNDWMFSVKEKPWHNLGEVIETAPDSKEAIKLAHLDWKVKAYPIFANGKPIPNLFANVREDTNNTLGIVKSRYQILQNDEAFSFVDEIMENTQKECKYETAGSLFNGKKVFMLVKLPTEKILDDEIENYMFFTNSHDGTSKVTSGITNIRVVCNNTLQLAIKNSSRIWTSIHCGDIKSKVKQAQLTLGLADEYLRNMKNHIEELATSKMSLDTFFDKMFKDVRMKDKSDKYKGRFKDNISYIYNNVDNLSNFNGSKWKIYNAVSDFISNKELTKQSKKEKRMDNFLTENLMLKITQDVLEVA